MEPIVLQYVTHDRYNKTCYICEEQGRESKAASGACMTCNWHGCRQAFHVTCAQMANLLCEEEGLEADNVQYCGYCKYHFSKMKSLRHSGSSSSVHGRSRSESPPHERHGSHHDKQKKSRKDKERPKQKHKKSYESSSRPVSSVSITTEKESSSHHVSSAKDTSEVNRSEVKGKKSTSHGVGHRGKKLGSSKTSGSFSSVTSSGSFQQGTPSSSLQTSQDFLGFSKLDQEEDKYVKPASSPHSSPASESPKVELFEQKVTVSSFGSIMRFTAAPPSQPRVREASPVDYKAPAPNPMSLSLSCHKHMPSLSTEEGEPVKEKKHKGSKKSKHGPGRPKGSKKRESAALAAAACTASGTLPMGSLTAGLTSSTRALGHDSTIPSLSIESPLLSSGIYTSNKDPISHGGGVLRAACSTPLSSSVFVHQGSSAHPQLNRSSILGGMTAVSSVSTTQVFSLPGSTFSLPPSHVFGSPLSGPSINPLLNQSENSQAEADLEDCSFVCRESSPRESLSSVSPISSLPTLFDQTVSCSGGRQQENVPHATSNIEQLLEKHGNGEAGVNIVEMLKSLHALQQENQRLQEQIMSLTAKKERLQILNVQLSVPFPAATSAIGQPSHTHHYVLSQSGQCGFGVYDSLNASKSPPSKISFATENSLSTTSEDPPSGCPSRSSSSLSYHSTPPPLPLAQQSPASLSLPGVPTVQQQQQTNGLGRLNSAAGGLGGCPAAPASVAPASALPTVPLVSGMMGNLAGGQQLPMNGIMGNLNGMMQPAAPMHNTQNALLQTSVPPSVQLSANLTSVPGLGLLSEQQKQFLQQQQQLQQLLTSQQLTPEQQALVFQMMQQRQRELQRMQMTGASQLPINSLLAATTAPPLASGNGLMTSSAAQPLHAGSSLMTSIAPPLNTANTLMASTAPPLLPGNNMMGSTGPPLHAAGPPVLTAQANPFLNMVSESSSQKPGRVNDKAASSNQDNG
ncbi:protein AF-17 isoform X2 [Latimeria chalumnae]